MGLLKACASLRVLKYSGVSEFARGAALVEFAIGAAVFFVIILGLVQVSHEVMQKAVMKSVIMAIAYDTARISGQSCSVYAAGRVLAELKRRRSHVVPYRISGRHSYVNENMDAAILSVELEGDIWCLACALWSSGMRSRIRAVVAVPLENHEACCEYEDCEWEVLY